MAMSGEYEGRLSHEPFLKRVGKEFQPTLLENIKDGSVLTAQHLQKTQVVGETVATNGHVSADVAFHTQDCLIVVIVVDPRNEFVGGANNLMVGPCLGTWK